MIIELKAINIMFGLSGKILVGTSHGRIRKHSSMAIGPISLSIAALVLEIACCVFIGNKKSTGPKNQLSSTQLPSKMLMSDGANNKSLSNFHLKMVISKLPQSLDAKTLHSSACLPITSWNLGSFLQQQQNANSFFNQVGIQLTACSHSLQLRRATEKIVNQYT